MNEKAKKTLTTIFAPITVFKDEWCALLLGMLLGSIVLFVSCYNLQLSHSDDAMPIISQNPSPQTTTLIRSQTTPKTISTLEPPIPAWSNYISSDFGDREDPTQGGKEFHQGVDIAVPKDTPIHAADSGTVTTAEVSDTGYGNHIVLSHSPSLSTLYGHCTTLLVTAGQHVNRGDVIATVGSSGDSTGPHLHFELLQNNSPINPSTFLP